MEQNGVKSPSENNNNDKVSWIDFGGLQLAHRDLRSELSCKKTQFN